jgi:hypothetical protein
MAIGSGGGLGDAAGTPIAEAVPCRNGRYIPATATPRWRGRFKAIVFA